MVIVLFTVIMMYALELTFVQNAQSLVNLAGYAAARKYAVNQDQEVAIGAAKTYLAPIMKVGGLDTEASVNVWFSDTPSFGQDFKVRVSMNYPLLEGVATLFPNTAVGTPETSQITYQGIAPPTRQQLGLSGNQVMTILHREQIGQQYYNWSWQVHTWKSWGIFGTSDSHYYGPYHAHLPYGQTPDWYNSSSGGFIGLGKHHKETVNVKKVGDGPALFEYTIQIITQGGKSTVSNAVQLVNWTPMSAD